MTARDFEITALGDDAVCIHCGEGDIRQRLAAQLLRGATWLEIVTGKRDVTVLFDPHAERMVDAMSRLGSILERESAGDAPQPKVHELRAAFGGDAGPDLSSLAQRLRMTESALVAQVDQSPLSVDMLGFTPGFAYLTGLHPGLVAERLATPRTRVPAGSIGLITGQIGLYALDGPGGWPIIGRILSPLFVRESADPFLLSPGDHIILRGSTAA